ncbi:MAG: hypothetical protein JWO31_3698, partial [Phycisphaerales bacterium]|nr:hypothetical protein [Phycisphaerales bacterium]
MAGPPVPCGTSSSGAQDGRRSSSHDYDPGVRLLRPLEVTADTPSSVLVREAVQRAAVSGVLF